MLSLRELLADGFGPGGKIIGALHDCRHRKRGSRGDGGQYGEEDSEAEHLC